VVIESTDAGWARTLFSLTRAAAVTCGIMNPEFSPAPGAREWGQAFAESGIDKTFQSAFADSGQRAESDR